MLIELPEELAATASNDIPAHGDLSRLPAENDAIRLPLRENAAKQRGSSPSEGTHGKIRQGRSPAKTDLKLKSVMFSTESFRCR